MTIIGTRRIEETVKSLRAPAKPGSASSLLAAGLTEWRASYQRLASVCPTIRMGAVEIVILEVANQSRFEFLGRVEVATFEKTTCQGAEPEVDLVEP